MKKFLQTILALVCLYNAAIAQPTAGLMAYWRMDGNYVDAGPNFINGTNSASTATTNYALVANKAMAYANPGSTVVQFATHPVNANLSFGTNQDFTIDFSLLTTSTTHAGGIYDNNLNYGGPGIFMWGNNGFPQLVFNFKNASALTTNGALPLNVWKHVACVRNGGATRIYINGVLNVTAAPGTLTPSYTLPGQFGTMSFSGFSPPQYNGHNGKIDELRIYNRALTATEILVLASVALPVKLTSFTAVNYSNNIKLQWQTQYEQNSKHYNIQRSTDGINFTNIDRVSAAGNSNVPLIYNYTDVLPASMQNEATVFYRLEAVDIDAGLSTSQIVAVDLKKGGIQLLVFPNPAKDVLQVQTNGMTGQFTLSITDVTGRKMYDRDILLQQGSNSTPINISHFGRGLYYVRLSNAKESFTKEFAKD